ncbi:hypothetical protein [Lunatibacter salilacus]|uniref:hypothetical protein n=1 Tax=Lunatibacter salilacus TaxID=2483804 RepID=UPI00131B2C61|nr:hypothetical protein [Lunatibacter salilacus]
MRTTQLFVEILITGFGGIAWILIFICSICGINLDHILNYNYSTFYIIPVTGFAYVLGILIDRLGYQLFVKYEKKNIPIVFKNCADYPKDKKGITYAKPIITYIMHKSKHLNDQMIYNRTRLRLTRSWTLNFFFIALSLLTYYLTQDNRNSEIFMVLSILTIVLCIYSFFIWKILAKDYYKNIKSSYDLLKEGKWISKEDIVNN